MYKAVFFDIDGTLQTLGLNQETYVPESNKRALKELREKEVKIFIASGRPINIIPEIEEKCEIQFDGYVMMNGQYVFNHEAMISKNTLPVDELEKALLFLIERQISVTVAEEDYVYQVEEIHHQTDQLYKNIASYKRIFEHPVYQIMPCIQESDVETEKEFFSILKSGQSARWIDFFMDVISKGSGKNTGIDKIIAYYGISLDETMAFGDAGNDVGMLKHVNMGIAMGNGTPVAKEAAKYITDPIDEEGIYNALKHFKVL